MQVIHDIVLVHSLGGVIHEGVDGVIFRIKRVAVREGRALAELLACDTIRDY